MIFNLTRDFINYIIAVTLGVVMLAIIVLYLLLLVVVVSVRSCASYKKRTRGELF